MRVRGLAMGHDVTRQHPSSHEVPMIRLLIRIGLSLLGNALGLWVASLILSDMSVSAVSYTHLTLPTTPYV